MSLYGIGSGVECFYCADHWHTFEHKPVTKLLPDHLCTALRTMYVIARHPWLMERGGSTCWTHTVTSRTSPGSTPTHASSTATLSHASTCARTLPIWSGSVTSRHLSHLLYASFSEGFSSRVSFFRSSSTSSTFSHIVVIDCATFPLEYSITLFPWTIASVTAVSYGI